MSNNFSEVKQQQELLFGAQFDKDAKDKDIAYEPAKRRRERSSYIRKEITKWFATVPLYESISVESHCEYDEIRDEWFHGSISVTGPRREVDYDATRNQIQTIDTKPVYKIMPGTLNASSWQAGVNGSSAQEVGQELQHRLKMMEMAIECLNRRNVLCLDWESVENPMQRVLELEERLSRYQERESVKKGKKLA